MKIWMAVSLLAAAALVGFKGVEEVPAPESAASAAFLDALASDVETLHSKVVGLANALDGEQYQWRPDEGVMSAGEVFMHIAAYNYYYPSMAGAEIPEGVGVTTDYSTVSQFQDSRSDRSEIIAALETSFEHLASAVGEASADALEGEVTVFGRSTTSMEAWYGTMTHIHEHLGQLIAYARANGVTPPWSM